MSSERLSKAEMERMCERRTGTEEFRGKKPKMLYFIQTIEKDLDSASSCHCIVFDNRTCNLNY